MYVWLVWNTLQWSISSTVNYLYWRNILELLSSHCNATFLCIGCSGFESVHEFRYLKLSWLDQKKCMIVMKSGGFPSKPIWLALEFGPFSSSAHWLDCDKRRVQRGGELAIEASQPSIRSFCLLWLTQSPANGTRPRPRSRWLVGWLDGRVLHSQSVKRLLP